MNELADAISAHAKVIRFPFVSTYDRRTRLFGALFDRRQQALVSRVLQERGADIAHINQQVAEDGCDLVLAAKRSGLPWVSTVHVSRSAADLGARGGALRDRACGQVISFAKGTHIAVSEVSRAQLAARFPFERSDFRVVHNGTSAPSAADLDVERAKVRHEWGVADDEILIGSVGRIETQKNPLGFVMAAAGLSPHNKIRCVWIGDGKLRDRVSDAARSRGVSLQIDGWRQDAARRLAGFDIFFLPSLFEGLPFAVLEAMHAGLPVVASKSDGLTEAICDGESGFLCETADQFAERLQLLVRDRNMRTKMGEKARADARALFSLEAMATRTLAVYRDTLAGKIEL
jgi:glycosyltransferase involved in cell wall biosynthesis